MGNIRMNNLWKASKVLLAVAAMGAMTQQARAVSGIAGGNVGLINSMTVLGVVSLDMGTTAVFQNIMTLLINNNAPGGFTLDFVAARGGEFVRTAAADGSGVSFTALRLSAGSSGTLGTGAAAIAPAGAQLYTPDLVAGAGGPTLAATMQWVGGAQTTATDQYETILQASWTGVSPLAGLYLETFTITLTAN